MLTTHKKINKQNILKEIYLKKKKINKIYEEIAWYRKQIDILHLELNSLISKYKKKLKDLRAKRDYFVEKSKKEPLTVVEIKEFEDIKTQISNLPSKMERDKKIYNDKIKKYEDKITNLFKEKSKLLDEISSLEEKLLTFPKEKRVAKETNKIALLLAAPIIYTMIRS